MREYVDEIVYLSIIVLNLRIDEGYYLQVQLVKCEFVCVRESYLNYCVLE